MADHTGQQLGNYRLLHLLGRGAFAEVYLAQHLVSGRRVAIKILNDQMTDADVERFRREGQIISALVHPHIVRLLELEAAGGIVFLVMEYAPKGTLRDRFPQGTQLPLHMVIAYVQQIAQALQYAHDRNWVHRDLKPENVLLGAQGQVLLSDFGVALLIQHTSTMSKKEVAGTAAYMAPEQIQSKPRAASDQYALAIMAYEWLAGERPFEGTPLELYGKQIHATPPSLLEKVPTLPPAVEQVIMIALAKDPKQRFPTVREFAEALEEASRGIAPVNYVPTQVKPPDPALASTQEVPHERRPVDDQQAGSGGVRTSSGAGLAQTEQPGNVPPFPRPPGYTIPPTPQGGRRGLLVKGLVAVLALALIVLAYSSYSLATHSGSPTGNHPTATSRSQPTLTPTQVAVVLSSTGTPTASAAGTASPTAARTATATPTPTNTPTPTPTPFDGMAFSSESGSLIVPMGQSFLTYFVLQNTGNTTWTDAGGYSLACTSTCLGAPSNITFGGQSVAPNQLFRFNINQVAPTSPNTYRSWWKMSHNGQLFGVYMYIDATVPVLLQSAPNCNNPSGTSWVSPNPTAVSASCPGNGLLMQQISSTKYGEFELLQANGGTYNQTYFQMQVQANYKNTGDCSTWAAVIFQTPTNTPGGYIFGVTTCGAWRLQHVISGTNIPTVASGNIGNVSQATITIVVHNGAFTGSINGNQVVSYTVGNPSGVADIGLMVQRDGAAPSSQVLYSNLELDI